MGTPWTLSVYGWDADAQDLGPPHEGQQRSKGRRAGCSAAVPDGEVPQDTQGAPWQVSLLCPIFGLNQLNAPGKGQQMGKEHEHGLV